MGGWMDGRESGVKDCLQQLKILIKVPMVIRFFKSLGRDLSKFGFIQ
jgi:hypothetical protein